MDELVACLVRPGFVHRLCGGVEQAEAHEPRPALGHSRRRVGDVVVDARCLGHPLSGTQVNVLGLLGGIVRAGANVSVLVPRDVHPTVAPKLVALREAMPFIERVGPGRPTVFHRPFQIASLKVLAECLSMGERLVLTHLDMILDRTPGYAGSTASWERYRSVTSAALSSADGLGFLSRHTANDAASDGVLDLDRVAVIHPGVDHLCATTDGPGGSPRVGGRPYLLVVGNAYWHKNRPFALRLFRWLVEHRGWDGALVLIGQHPEPGSSRSAETVVLEEAPVLAGRVIDLGHVTDAERDSLYRGAELVLFPSLSEGFGFVPFEAATFGRACAYARRSSMSELLPADGALPSFDLEEAGPFVLGLLESEAARERLVAAVRAAAAPLTWDRAAAGYLALYARAAGSAPRGVSRTLVVSSPEGASRTSEHEARVLDIYRRRRVFRVAVEAAIRAGSTRLRVPRRGPKD